MATRTGLRTIYTLLRKVCQIIAKFTPALSAILSPTQMVYLNAVNQACHDFILNVNVPQILGDEDA
jgi:hypothetical protein